MEEQENKARAKKATRLSVSIIVIVALSLMVVSAFTLGILQKNHVINLFGTSSATSTSSKSSVPVLQNTGSAKNGSYTAPIAVESSVTITDKLSSAMSFPSGSIGTTGNWICENLQKNNVIVQAQVYLGGKLIATSAPIKPGQHIENLNLSANVVRGNYDAIVLLNYFNITTQAFISRSGYKVSLSVA